RTFAATGDGGTQICDAIGSIRGCVVENAQGFVTSATRGALTLGTDSWDGGLLRGSNDVLGAWTSYGYRSDRLLQSISSSSGAPDTTFEYTPGLEQNQAVSGPASDTTRFSDSGLVDRAASALGNATWNADFIRSPNLLRTQLAMNGKTMFDET